VLVFPGEIALAVGAPTEHAHPRLTSGTGARGEFPVREGAVAVLAELVWTGAAGDLDLSLLPPGASALDPLGVSDDGRRFSNTQGSPLEPDRPVRVLVSPVTDMLGVWRYEVSGKAAVQASFALYVSVFYHGGPSETYTAVPALA
ncbi:MAG TPA: hypothetical protein VM681_07285, partial [Candidatus Thermoplasmatota archaeon]|nr:hypothetical protein [Candidatus Thermoplasmatota archaeon]